MSLPARPQTFAMENCRDVRDKLEWEIAGLKACPVDRGPEPMIYHAFNCAVTVWTLADWVWLDMDPAQQARWGTNAKGQVVLSAFQSWCRGQCRALHLCRQVATASKHAAITAFPDHAVATSVEVDVTPARFGTHRFGEPYRTWKWKLTIHDGPQPRDAMEVFEEALTFWDHFMGHTQRC